VTLLWCSKAYVECVEGNERRAMAWYRLGIWRVKGKREYVEKGKVHCVKDKKTLYIYRYSAVKLQTGNPEYVVDILNGRNCSV
jgi:hypothetical protein